MFPFDDYKNLFASYDWLASDPRWTVITRTVTRQNQPPAPRIQCAYCHSMVQDNQTNCRNCGAPAQREETTP